MTVSLKMILVSKCFEIPTWSTVYNHVPCGQGFSLED